MEIDQLRMRLIPKDVPTLDQKKNTLKAVTILGNGNCLFNALSYLLVGMCFMPNCRGGTVGPDGQVLDLGS